MVIIQFISEIIEKPVFDSNGKIIGKCKDCIISAKRSYPVINAIIIRGAHKKDINIPWEYINNSRSILSINTTFENIKEYNIDKNDIKLVEDVFDKQLVDVEGKKIRRINDLQVSPVDNHYRLIGVDVSLKGALRRLGLEKIASSLKINLQEDYIDWKDIDVSTSRDNIFNLKLKVHEYDLKKLHPADIADIVEKLSVKDSVTILNSFDVEVAADILEEISQENQMCLLDEIDPKKAANILNKMSPDDATDLLSCLSNDKLNNLLELMDPDESKDLKKLLKYPEDTAGGIMTTEVAAVFEDLKAGEIIDKLKEIDKDAESIYYIYAKSKQGYLTGVASLKQVLFADPDKPLKEFMTKDVISVDVNKKQTEVIETISKYNLLAVPVVDNKNHLKGIVTVDDAIELLIPK
ncbi:magnesium transporter [Methanobacterium sp.]|uniref:magnesium transporter n=1 Tax=Methanobacterium sp. TaxID=2164 RepID=UPI003C72706F